MTDANRASHDLEQWLASPSTQTSPLHLVEQQQDLKGREVQRLLLQSHVDLRGPGHIGPSLRVAQGDSISLFTHRRLQRPERSFSCELQKRLIKASIQGPFREATSRILESSGITIHNHSLEPLLIEAAVDFDSFYGQ